MTKCGPSLRRVVIEDLSPRLDGGRYPIKRILGDVITVEADVFSESHERVTPILKFRHEKQDRWTEVAMTELGNDRWKGSFRVDLLGVYLYTVEAWAGRDRHEGMSSVFRPCLQVVVDPELARFGAWYQLFPRSCASQAGEHGTFRDVAERLPRLADLGFDVLHMPPIHPIGRTSRKGKNNSLVAHPDDPGSPWAVGAAEGGHKSIHPALGTLEDFRFLLSRAKELGIQLALDIAFQCSPDHPYVKEHPEWFRRSADGSIRFVEDPPERYEDVLPLDFSTERRGSLWEELKSVVEYWIQEGVRLFRVDNPHTKPFVFWKWLIGDLKRRWPELIFLSEGLTRPKPMTYLAKIGFTQSYDYFPWRNSKAELTEYYTSLNSGDVKEFFRPVLWLNTPQFLPPILQSGGRAAFMIRLVLAATLGAAYGIYGPAYDRCECRAAGPGSVHYLDSEQYELKCWPWGTAGDLDDLLSRVNRIRRLNPALHSNDHLCFHPVKNDAIIAYSKTTEDHGNTILTVVNLDPHHVQRGWLELAISGVGLDGVDHYSAHDLLTDRCYTWSGASNYVELDPHRLPAHVFRLERGVS